MKKFPITASLLALLLLCACAAPAPAVAPTAAPAPSAVPVELSVGSPESGTEPVQTPDPGETPVGTPEEPPAQASASRRLSFTEEEGPEEGVRITYWSYDGNEVAEFLAVPVPVPEEFPIEIGTMYEGTDAALLSGVVRGDSEGGTAELVLVTDLNTETVLTLMYSRERVALLELDADMLSFCLHDDASGLWTVVFTDDGPLSFAAAGAMLTGLTEKYALSPVFLRYGLDPAGPQSLRAE